MTVPTWQIATATSVGLKSEEQGISTCPSSGKVSGPVYLEGKDSSQLGSKLFRSHPK